MSRIIILIVVAVAAWYLWRKYDGSSYLGGLGTGNATAIQSTGGSQLY